MNSKKLRSAISDHGGRSSVLLILLLSLSAALPLAAQDLRPVYRVGGDPLPLTGQWMRYSGYVDETAASASAAQSVYVGLRGRFLPSPAVPEGAVSYRFVLEISGAPGTRLYALNFPALNGYRSIAVNGQTLYDSAAGNGGSSTLFFPSPADRISIIVQSPPGGPRLEAPGPISAEPQFGEAAVIDARKNLLAGIVFVEIAYFALGGFLMLFLFLFWRKNREFRTFALFLAASAIFYLLKSSSVFPSLSRLLGQHNLEIAFAASFAVVLSCFTLFLRSVFTETLSRPLAGTLAILPLAIAAAAILMPDYFPIVFALEAGYSGLFALFVLVFLFIVLFSGNRQARWLAPAFLVWAASLVCAVLFRESILSLFVLEPAGQFVFSFVAWLMLIKKVGDTFESTETLSDYVSTVTTTVGKFIPKEFLEALDKTDVIDLKLGDHVRREMTIFFSDIRAFTELSEKLTVEENFAFINSYLSRVVPIVKENGGFVDKYIGDAIMALFPGPRGPDEAIRSAIAMQGKIVEYNGHRAKMGYRPISMGVGVHSGDLMLGVVGVSDRMENTVISDAVNLASRLQAITKAFNISLAISEQAFKELDDPGTYKYRFIGKVRVKGKAAPVSVFEIFDGIAPDLFERKMKANMFFEQGMLSYYQKDFAGAMYYFKRVLDIIPEDGAASFYLDHCLNKAAL
ncbi:MAG: hypothetical protein M0Z80_13480 [Treponema sp.]|nr:hypothetical protein [Treponema sp.]